MIRHALSARRRALDLLEPIADDREGELRAYTAFANLELARLHAARGERDKAQLRATQAIDVYERAYAHQAARQGRAIIDSRGA